MKITRWISALAMTCAMLLSSPARADAEPKVNDQAHFFKQETIDKVDAELKQLKSDTNVEIVVETFAAIPDNLKDAYESAKDDPDRKHEFYQSWIESRGRELKLSGVYVLIVKQPSHLEVLAGHRTHEKALPRADQEKMTSILLDDFKAKRFDEGLERAIDFARGTIKRNLNGEKHQAASGYDPFDRGGGGTHHASATTPPPYQTPAQPPASHSNFGVCMWIGLIIIGAIVLLSILSRLGSSRGWGGGGYGGGPGYGGGYGYGPGPSRGGGFFSGLFGGLLGGAAGSYFENRMEDHNRNSYGSGTMNTGGDAGTGGGQSDYGSTGGDFGSSSSSDFGSTGGDFGSSSSSSDFGSTGGDFGGGGGDSGGGGGSSGGDF